MKPAHDDKPQRNHLRALRRNRGFAQKHVARMVGCTVNALSHYERGTAVPPLKTGLLLEIVLGAKLSEVYVDWFHALRALALQRAAPLPARLNRHLRERVLGKDFCDDDSESG